MKFICLGYFDQEVLDVMNVDEVNAFIDECRVYGDSLRNSGQVVNVELLQSPDYAKSVRNVGGKVVVDDGPVARMEKVLIAIITLDVDDIDQAVELMSKHPAIKKSGSMEIRYVDDIREMLEESRQRGE